MAQKAQPARGMRDVVPPLGELRRQVANRVLDVYARYGFEVIETPALEDIGVLIGSQGGDNEKLVFKVLQRGAKLEEAIAGQGELADLGLRFDLTVPLARFVANHFNELPMPFKVAHVAPVWRAERPQKGRYREFVQCDIDMVGEAGPAAEIELCCATLDALRAVGIPGCSVHLNDRRLLRAAVERHLGAVADPTPVYIALDKLDKIGPAKVAEELSDYGAAGVEALLSWLQTADMTEGPDEVVAGLESTVGALRSAGYPVEFDPALVRGMGYYTGQIFEVAHPDVGYSLAGGGRYDGMTARFGAPPLPMCGFSIGFERICDLVDPALFGAAGRKVAVLCNDQAEQLACLSRAASLRQAEPAATFNVLRRARNARKQHGDLSHLGYTEIIEAVTFLA